MAIKKIGVVAMSNLSVGGGYARVVRDLINALSKMNYNVFLLTRSEINYKRIEKFHGKIKLEKIYQPKGIKSFFCRDEILSRKLMKKEFEKMTKEVDLIIDVDGKVLHKYLPENFDRKKYIIWRVSCAERDVKKFPWMVMGFKRRVKEKIKNLLENKEDIPEKDIKIYPLDEWTKKELINYWKVKPEEFCLYPEIKVNEFLHKKIKKKSQIVVLGRIAPNKVIDDLIKIFSRGTKNFPEYRLIILGGTTPDSNNYIDFLNKIIKNEGVSNKVRIIKDPSFQELKNVLLESKILLDSHKEVSLTMTAIEALAAGVIVLAYKNSGTYEEVLDKGRYGWGFLGVEEGSARLEEILKSIKHKRINLARLKKRADFFSRENFVKRLKKIIKEIENER